MAAAAGNCPLAREARTCVKRKSGGIQVAPRTAGECTSRHPGTSTPTRTGRSILVPLPSCVPGGARSGQETCGRAIVPPQCGGEYKTSALRGNGFQVPPATPKELEHLKIPGSNTVICRYNMAGRFCRRSRVHRRVRPPILQPTPENNRVRLFGNRCRGLRHPRVLNLGMQ